MSYMLRAREADAAGDLAGARDAYRRAIDTGEGGTAARLLLLEVLDVMHDDEAVLALCDDLEGKGKNPIVRSAAIAIARANVYVRNERWERAIETARAAIAQIAEDGEVAGPGRRLTPFDAWLVLGQAYKFSGDAAASIEPYRRALELVPVSRRAHFELAQAYAKLGELAEAERLAVRGTELDPENNDIHYNLACYRARLGKREAALAALTTAIALDAGNAALAREDADLASLRDDPEFQRLTA